MKTLIKIDNLTFAYNKTPVLENICLEIKQNDFLAIIGPNGGGKTTLLKLILKILKSKKNSISYNIDESSIAYVPQNTNLNLQFPITALEVVLMGHKIKRRKLFGYSKEELLGMNRFNLVHKNEIKKIKQKKQTGKQATYEVIARDKKGHLRPVLVRGSNITINDKIHRVSIILDLTELKKTQKELEVLNKELAIKIIEEVEKSKKALITYLDHLLEKKNFKKKL